MGWRALRGLVADTEAPSGARVRAATALMDRADLTPAYAVEVRHKEDHAQLQATEAFRDPQDLARDILRALPEVVGCLPREKVEVWRERLTRLPGSAPTSAGQPMALVGGANVAYSLREATCLTKTHPSRVNPATRPQRIVNMLIRSCFK